jgi:DNA-binding NarL/FixJ family response regulator
VTAEKRAANKLREAENITIAVVDDHPIVLQGIARILDGEPGICVAATAPSVDELLDNELGVVHVVLLDLDLGDGTDVTTNIHRLLETGSTVVVFSALALPENVRAAVRAGACGYVPKSDDLESLVTAIQAAARGSGWVSPELAFVLLTDDAPDRPSLSEKELQALLLYATGQPLKTVAQSMGVSFDTAKQYLDRVRLKYRQSGRQAASKVDLYRRAVEDGYLANPG